MVYEEPFELDTSTYNSDWGVGLRVDIPGFPLRFDYAWPLETDEFNDRDNGRFQFTIGYGF
jgi:outer membrane protein assembly factor BamA